MKDRFGVFAQESFEGGFVVQVALNAFKAGIDIFREGDVEQADLGDGPLLPFGVGKTAFLEQRLRQPVAEKSASTRDCQFHGDLLVKCQ